MSVRGISAALVLTALAAPSLGQTTTPQVSVETVRLTLIDQERYQVPIILEANRRIAVAATVDGVVKSVTAQLGSNVREGQEIAQLDRSEAAAALKIAQAGVKEAEALLRTSTNADVSQAQLDAAQARAELAQIAVDRCIIRAPFAGRVLALPVTPGQFVLRGATIADIADVTSLKVLTPIERTPTMLVGSVTRLYADDQPLDGRVQAILPLHEEFAALRELNAALGSAWVVVPNASGNLEPGQRVRSPILPDAPITTVPASAVRTPEARKGSSPGQPQPRAPIGDGTVQVLRNDYVTDLPVRILGKSGPDRLQVYGPFRPSDALIVYSKVPLVPGTLVRFSTPPASLEARPPDPNARGDAASITPPGTGVAPIGPPGSAVPKGRGPATKAAPAQPKTDASGGSVPF